MADPPQRPQELLRQHILERLLPKLQYVVQHRHLWRHWWLLKKGSEVIREWKTIERLWRDLWIAVSCTYYDVLHTLEEDGLLDISNTLHIFCAHYVFLPRLRADLQTFVEGWNHHPLRTEGNLTPQQMWQMGLLQNNIDEPENVEVVYYLQGLDIDSESATDHEESDAGIVVPEFESPLNEEEVANLRSTIDPTAPSDSHGRDLYVLSLHYLQQLRVV
ncbi:hypothetical protein SKAU_G00094240 [Synaphobranchus kaupii]|uniref:Integrase core domain-containing protein n=1 Tax=Synaphobranchus kaupii TaxID=118154 RepID=A0A9Q1FY77_SYNKA|nr:hypothetical protein SKAU_G00094240 [Synaphobranchus kaupii]